ncbi:MAG: hypothetical protein ACE5NJ_11880, partial [Thermodesulfobacteriota bacterium]
PRDPLYTQLRRLALSNCDPIAKHPAQQNSAPRVYDDALSQVSTSSYWESLSIPETFKNIVDDKRAK